MKKFIKILIFLLIPLTASSQIDDYPWYWQNHLAPIFLADSTDMLGKVKFGTNGVYIDSVKYASDTLYFYTDSTSNPFKMILNPGSGSGSSGDSSWVLATVTEGLILPTGDTLKGMYPLNDSTMVIVNSDTTCMSGCSGSGGTVGSYDTIGIVTDVDLTGGAITQVNTGQSASIPKVISIQDTLYNEYEDAFDIQYRLSTTWYIDIYSATAYDSLTIYWIKDDAGQGGGGSSGGGNITSSQAQNLATQTDQGIVFIDGDSLATDSSFIFTGSTKTAGAFYTGTSNPTNFDRKNYDGAFYATRGNFQFPTGGAISGNEPLTVYNPYQNSSYFASTMTSIRPGVLHLVQNGTYSASIHTSNVLEIDRTISVGVHNIEGNIIDITDNPTTSGTYISKILTATIGATERISLSPRATGTTFGYLFDTDSSIDSLWTIRNNGVRQFQISNAGTKISNNLTVNGNTTFGDGTITDNDATPDVASGNIYTYNGTSNSVTVTDLDNPIVGTIYRIIGNSDTYTITINDSGNFNLSANWVGGIDDVITIFVQADNDYIEISRSNN